MSFNSLWGATWTAAWQMGQAPLPKFRRRQWWCHQVSINGSLVPSAGARTWALPAHAGLLLGREQIPSPSCRQAAPPPPQPPAHPPAPSPALCKRRGFQLPSWPVRGCPSCAPLPRGLRNVVPDMPYCGWGEQKGTGSSKGNKTDYLQDCSWHQLVNLGVPQETTKRVTCQKHPFFLLKFKIQRMLPTSHRLGTDTLRQDKH